MEHTTFGKSPAAMYLAELLIQKNDQSTNKRVTNFITSYRRTLHDVVFCHYNSDEMKVKTFGHLINLIEHGIRTTAVDHIKEEHIAHLTVNLLIGEIKTMKKRYAAAMALRKKLLQKPRADGEPEPLVKAFPPPDEDQTERVEMLRERSRAYLERKGKINTLY